MHENGSVLNIFRRIKREKQTTSRIKNNNFYACAFSFPFSILIYKYFFLRLSRNCVPTIWMWHKSRTFSVNRQTYTVYMQHMHIIYSTCILHHFTLRPAGHIKYSLLSCDNMWKMFLNFFLSFVGFCFHLSPPTERRCQRIVRSSFTPIDQMWSEAKRWKRNSSSWPGAYSPASILITVTSE